MKTQLIEFQNSKDEILRGILVESKNKPRKGVIFVNGFERSGTVEPKFKDLSDKLYNEGISSMRFDFSGLGLSDGNFKNTTLNNWTKEFSNAYDFFKSKTETEFVYVVGHSLGNCVIGKYLEQNPKNIKKAVLISPALNQRDLMRYWFVSRKMKNENPEQLIKWNNYREFLDESEFQKDANKTDKMSKYNFIGAEYFQECSKLDLSNSFKKYRNEFLCILGDSDETVPTESLSVDFLNKIIVNGGDHDMEKPNQRIQWIDKAVEYLKK